MFNQKSFKSVESKVFNQFRGIDPTYNLANIPGTILKHFGVPSKYSLPQDVFGDINLDFSKLVLFVIDGFGYETFEKLLKTNIFLNHITDTGVVSKLTTQFPSTTTTNITTLQSGLPISETGVTEWYFYEPILDTVYNPLTYKLAKTKETVSVNPDILLPFPNVYQQLNVKSYVIQYHLYNSGPYSEWMNRGSESVKYNGLDEGLDKLKTILNREENSYSYFYIGDFDEASHNYSPYSIEANHCINEILAKIENFINNLKQNHNGNVLFMITADHGQTTVDKNKAVYLNLAYPEIIPYLKQNKKGELIVPCGSFRDMFLHVLPEYIDYLTTYLSEKLKGKAEVYKITDLINTGIFQNPSKRFLERVGDIVILAYKDEAVWWYEENNFYVKHLGMHGGLLKEEMEIPLIVFDLVKQ